MADDSTQPTGPTIDDVLIDESWIARNWRPLAAIVYLVICVFDFILAPSWMYLTRDTTAHLVATLQGAHLSDAVQTILVTPRAAWTPLTLQGAGMFHIAFGGILGVSAWSRGTEKRELIKSRVAQLTQQLGTQITSVIPASAGIVQQIETKVEDTANTMLNGTTGPDNPDKQ